MSAMPRASWACMVILKPISDHSKDSRCAVLQPRKRSVVSAAEWLMSAALATARNHDTETLQPIGAASELPARPSGLQMGDVMQVLAA